MIVSFGAEKAFDKNQYPLLMKKKNPTQKTRNRRKLAQMIKAIDEPTADIILSGGRLKAFHPTRGREREHSRVTLLLNTILEAVVRATSTGTGKQSGWKGSSNTVSLHSCRKPQPPHTLTHIHKNS